MDIIAKAATPEELADRIKKGASSVEWQFLFNYENNYPLPKQINKISSVHTALYEGTSRCIALNALNLLFCLKRKLQ